MGFVFFAFDFFPQHIIKKLGLGPGSIFMILGTVLGLLALIFALVSLVITSFPVGKSVSTTIHTFVSGASAYAAKQKSDKTIGFEDTMSNLKKQLEAKALVAVVSVLGVSKTVVERIVSLTSSIL